MSDTSPRAANRFAAVALATLMSLSATIQAAVPSAFFTSARDEALAGAPTDEGELSVPWFDRIQLRVSRDDSDQAKQGYSARLRPKTPGQYRAEKAILALRASRNAAGTTEVIGAALQRRFELLIELNLQQQQQRLASKRQRLAQRAVKAQRASVGSSEFRPGALQQAELRVTATRRQARLAGHRLKRSQQQIAALLSGTQAASASIDLGDLLAIDALMPALTAATQLAAGAGGNEHNPALDLARLDVDIARQQLERERKRSGLGLRFIELRHDRDRDNRGGDNRITIGIDMPLGRSFSSSDRQLQHNQAEYRMHRLHRRQQLEREQVEDELSLLLEEYHIQQDALADINTRLARHNRSTPVVLTLALQRERLDAHERQALLQADIYRRYIDALSLKGLLATEPLRNWLIAGNPVL